MLSNTMSRTDRVHAAAHGIGVLAIGAGVVIALAELWSDTEFVRTGQWIASELRRTQVGVGSRKTLSDCGNSCSTRLNGAYHAIV